MNLAREKAWGWYGRYLARERWTLALVAAASAVLTLANLPVLWLVRHALDGALPQGNIQAILLAGAGILACRMFAAGMTLALAKTSARRVRKITAEMRCD